VDEGDNLCRVHQIRCVVSPFSPTHIIVDPNNQAKQELAGRCIRNRARVEQLREELASLTRRVQETQRQTDALGPLLLPSLGHEAGGMGMGKVVVVSTADMAARVGRTKAALQALQVGATVTCEKR
jgi:hypothetical protein